MIILSTSFQIQHKINFKHDNQEYVLFKDHEDRYVLALGAGDKYVTYGYRTTDLQDLILQYPFIKEAAKHFIFDEEMDDIING